MYPFVPDLIGWLPIVGALCTNVRHDCDTSRVKNICFQHISACGVFFFSIMSNRNAK